MEFDKIIELIQAVSKSNLTQFTIEDGDLKISMKTDKQTKVVTSSVPMPVMMQQGPEQKSGTFAQVPMSQETGVEALPSEEKEISGNIVESPLVGTFYNAPSPDAKSYVNVGDTVKKGQILGIVEAMKLMNEIESEFDGVVEQILVENEQMVEYGQPLFVIR